MQTNYVCVFPCIWASAYVGTDTCVCVFVWIPVCVCAADSSAPSAERTAGLNCRCHSSWLPPAGLATRQQSCGSSAQNECPGTSTEWSLYALPCTHTNTHTPKINNFHCNTNRNRCVRVSVCVLHVAVLGRLQRWTQQVGLQYFIKTRITNISGQLGERRQNVLTSWSLVYS